MRSESFKDQLQDIKTALISHLKANGETGGILDNEWRNFRVPSFIKDPDAALLIQDLYTPWSDANIKGYTE